MRAISVRGRACFNVRTLAHHLTVGSLLIESSLKTQGATHSLNSLANNALLAVTEANNNSFILLLFYRAEKVKNLTLHITGSNVQGDEGTTPFTLLLDVIVRHSFFAILNLIPEFVLVIGKPPVLLDMNALLSYDERRLLYKVRL